MVTGGVGDWTQSGGLGFSAVADDDQEEHVNWYERCGRRGQTGGGYLAGGGPTTWGLTT